MKENKNKESTLLSLTSSVEKLCEVINHLDDRLVNVANFIKERVSIVEKEPITSGMSREDITIRNHILMIAKTIESMLRGDKNV